MQSYNSLNDASEKYENLRGLQPGDTKIWYYRNIPKAHNLIRGVEWMEKNNIDLPTPDTLEETHVLLGQIKAANSEQIYTLLQGETWSPEGEANDMLVDNGIKHTSMSVGDIIEFPDGKLLMADVMGFYDLIGGKEMKTQKEPEEKKESYRKVVKKAGKVNDITLEDLDSNVVWNAIKYETDWSTRPLNKLPEPLKSVIIDYLTTEGF